MTWPAQNWMAPSQDRSSALVAGRGRSHKSAMRVYNSADPRTEM
jgi:hypothetical protein